jgi:hypothetical protein
MPLQHGNKRYMQVLLDSARYAILEKQATKLNVRVTALARQVVYEWLVQNADPGDYEEAAAKDQEQWLTSVRNRIAGKKAKKLDM